MGGGVGRGSAYSRVVPLSRRRCLWSVALAAVLTVGLGGCVRLSRSEPDSTPSTAADRLGALTVASAGSMRGYSRDRFPHWQETGRGCDVRDSVLRRDGEDVRLRGCNVVGGRWVDPYEGRTFTATSQVAVDHVVPLANAWRSGASKWTDERRERFANDLDRPELRAVSASVNRAKGDQDPSSWKPQRRDYWCRYAQDWITVKHHWQLSVTAAEKIALVRMLETCT